MIDYDLQELVDTEIAKQKAMQQEDEWISYQLILQKRSNEAET